jgi:tryptophan halogenase
MTDTPPRRRVVIAGGGTAGWIAASALSRQLGGLIDVTLIESEAIGTIGVGEATIPTTLAFHRLIGLDERDFLRATGATFKLGIAFENWARIGDRYIHAFGDTGRSTWMGGFQHFWLEARRQGFGGPLADYSLEATAAAADRFATSEAGELAYAYHLDAARYAAYLRLLAEKAGTHRIEGHIERIEVTGGRIDAVMLRSGERVVGDLFIDCTGFRALLIGGALGVGYEDWRHWLPTDSAVAVQSRSVAAPHPYTRAIAHDAGWRWQIPLRHRTGNGLVYDSRHLSDDAARARLLASIEGDPVGEPRVIRYRAGRRDRVWAGNCIALGLSSGFVEPLESTSIHLAMIGVTRLLQLFPATADDAVLAERYNDLARRELENVRDFVVLHYSLTERDDSVFWRTCRDMVLPDSLAARIALFRGTAQAYQGPDDLFRPDSWVQVMIGQRVEPVGHHPMAGLMGAERLHQTLAGLRSDVAARMRRLPAHGAFLDSHVGPADAVP